MSPADLPARILQFIRTGTPIDDDKFDALALELLMWQMDRNDFYRAYVQASGANLPTGWIDIPALPTSAWKRTAIRSFPEDRTLTYFQTSGTTEGESGRHYFESLEWYEEAIVPNFRTHLLPGVGRIPMAILTPPPDQAPHSSLVHMMEVVRQQFGTDDSAYYLRDGQLQSGPLRQALHRAETSGEPLLLLGTAFSFLFFMDELTAEGRRFHLPEGSRIMETGGFKGRTREVPRADFYLMLGEAFDVPQHRIVNEYGMTELSSQFYDISFVDGQPTALKSVPAWCRVRAVDPLTHQPVPEGEPGLLRIWDLANIGSCAVLQTEDVGTMHGPHFEVHGRVPTAPPRGCSLGAEQALGR